MHDVAFLSAAMRSDMSGTKAALRHVLRSARRAIADDVREAAHRRMARSLMCLREGLAAGGYVALYAASPGEADPTGLVDLVPDQDFAFPRVHGAQLELVACAPGDLVAGYRGILEPPPRHRAIPLSQVRMLVVPGLAFDRAGHRLGQGGGHYDRLVARLRASAYPGLIVGLAYALQVVPEVPHEAHDERVDVVVTEDGLVGES